MSTMTELAPCNWCGRPVRVRRRVLWAPVRCRRCQLRDLMPALRELLGAAGLAAACWALLYLYLTLHGAR